MQLHYLLVVVVAVTVWRGWQ